MPRELVPSPAINITQSEARRFLLAHHLLYPPRILKGKTGILDYIRHVGCIQFDPINIVGRNPDLVLQSRVKDYRPNLLEELLYTDKLLLDGWDKMAAIYLLEDWPNFSRRRQHLRESTNTRRPPQAKIEEVLLEVRHRGPLSSLDFEDSPKVDWYWGPTKVVRAVLEHLYAEGYLGIDHRVNNRRSFDLIERLIPTELFEESDPFHSLEDYQEWHVLRRIGSMGLADSKSGENWYGILGVKSSERNSILNKLSERDEIIPIGIDEFPGSVFFIRQMDLPTLKDVIRTKQPKARASIIAPLDNFIWNRKLIQKIFHFEYVWEVYKPKSKRKFGYYVLPVIYGERFIARFEPAFNKKSKVFTLKNWWWEPGITVDSSLETALTSCMEDFLAYLNALDYQQDERLNHEETLHWARNMIIIGN